MNFVMLPMWIFSGVFFSPSRFPDAILPLIRLLPLTALNEALRAVMIDGASVASVAGQLGILGLWGAAAFAIALRLFRWQ
jgi:ABC-type polysaccharide/polyol phosphate export permease